MGTRLADAATEQALRCPVCLDEMVAPTATPCGHAFCEHCIRTALEVKKECPTCRSAIASHRSLRPVVSHHKPHALAVDYNEVAGDSLWRCGTCTLENMLAASRCEACGSRRPSSTIIAHTGPCRDGIGDDDGGDDGGDDGDDEYAVSSDEECADEEHAAPHKKARSCAPGYKYEPGEVRRGPGARKLDRAAAPVVAGGLRLHTSAISKSGYLRVYHKPRKAGNFQARRQDESVIGYYPTAEEAAIAFAREMGEAPDPEDPAHAPPEDPARVVEYAEGMRLHLSKGSTTGYHGVTLNKRGRDRPYESQLKPRGSGGRTVGLGAYATAIEAAVACMPARLEPNHHYCPAAATADRRGFDVCGRADARAAGEYEPPTVGVAREAEGLRLHLSSRNATGYSNVTCLANPNNPQPLNRPYMAAVRYGVGRGARRTLGYYATAVEAAVAIARVIGEAETEPAPDE